MGSASGSATVPASAARSPAGSRAPECPKNATREPPTEANLVPPLKTVDDQPLWIRETLIKEQLLIGSEADNDVPVTVDDANEEDQTYDDLA